MFNTFFKWILFISSYAPLYLLVAINNYDYGNSVRENIENYSNDKVHLTFWLILFILVIISFIPIIVMKRISMNGTTQLFQMTNYNENILSYIITYVVPLTVININETNSLLVNVILFIMIGIIYVKNDLIYLNILLLLTGFRVYCDQNNIKIITDYSNNEVKEILVSKKVIPLRKLSNEVILIRKI